jgi:hypothetical protein
LWEVLACDFQADSSFESLIVRFRRPRCWVGPTPIFQTIAAAVDGTPEANAARTRLFQAEKDLREARTLAEQAAWAVDDLVRGFHPERVPVAERAALVADHERRLAELRAARGHAETVVELAEQARDAAKRTLADAVRQAIVALHPGDLAERQQAIDLLLRRLALGLSAAPDVHGRPTPGVLDQLFEQMVERRYIAASPGHILDEQVGGILGTFVEFS